MIDFTEDRLRLIPLDLSPQVGASTAVRFWSKVDKSGTCWEWRAAISQSDGYGAFGMGRGQVVKAHRMAWELVFGPVATGKMIRHLCDNRPCVRPSHLLCGTQKENMIEMMQRGRSTAKLDVASVRAFRELVNSGWSQAKAGRLFGIGPAQASRIMRGESWRHA